MTDHNYTLEGANIPIHWDHVDFVLNCFAAGLKPKARARALARVHERADWYDRFYEQRNVTPLRGHAKQDAHDAAVALRALVSDILE